MMTDSEILDALDELQSLTREKKIEWRSASGGQVVDTEGLPGYKVQLDARQTELQFSIEGPRSEIAYIGDSDGRTVATRADIAGRAYALLTLARQDASTEDSADFKEAAAKVRRAGNAIGPGV